MPFHGQISWRKKKQNGSRWMIRYYHFLTPIFFCRTVVRHFFPVVRIIYPKRQSKHLKSCRKTESITRRNENCFTIGKIVQNTQKKMVFMKRLQFLPFGKQPMEKPVTKVICWYWLLKWMSRVQLSQKFRRWQKSIFMRIEAVRMKSVQKWLCKASDKHQTKTINRKKDQEIEQI